MKQEFLVSNLERRVYTIYKAWKTLMEIGMQVTSHLISACSSTKLLVVWMTQKVLQWRRKALVNASNWLLMNQQQKSLWTLAGLIPQILHLIKLVLGLWEQEVPHAQMILPNRCLSPSISFVIQMLRVHLKVWNKPLTHKRVSLIVTHATCMCLSNTLQVAFIMTSDRSWEWQEQRWYSLEL